MDDGLPRTKEIRLSDADREMVITQLREATDEGRINLLEFEDRAGQVYAAQFPSELTPITADLPIPAHQLPAPRVIRPHDIRAEQVAIGPTRWSVQIMGANKRRGDWNTGGHTKTLTVMGSQLLDLTEVTSTDVTITAFSFMGGTEIIVPDGATVDLDGFILFGGTSNKTNPAGASPSDNSPSEMVVRIRTLGAMGGCTVRNLKGRERKKRGLPRK